MKQDASQRCPAAPPLLPPTRTPLEQQEGGRVKNNKEKVGLFSTRREIQKERAGGEKRRVGEKRVGSQDSSGQGAEKKKEEGERRGGGEGRSLRRLLLQIVGLCVMLWEGRGEEDSQGELVMGMRVEPDLE